ELPDYILGATLGQPPGRCLCVRREQHDAYCQEWAPSVRRKLTADPVAIKIIEKAKGKKAYMQYILREMRVLMCVRHRRLLHDKLAGWAS
ncbi:unnamed protein product, partial [Symbiodinium natans]